MQGQRQGQATAQAVCLVQLPACRHPQCSNLAPLPLLRPLPNLGLRLCFRLHLNTCMQPSRLRQQQRRGQA